MPACPEHGLQIDQYARFCGECGSKLIEIPECPSCKRQRAKQDKFCKGCGDKLPSWESQVKS